MQRWMITTAAAALWLALGPAHGEPAAQGAGERGRYEGVAASATVVWVVDSHTGRVRKCTQEFADQTPVCSDFSN